MMQSALHPQADVAQALAGLFWPVTLLLAAIWLAVMLLLAGALWRRRAAAAVVPRHARLAIGVASLGTVLVVIGLSVASYLVTRRLTAAAEAPLVVQVRGLQWWWQVSYPAEGDAPGFVTANELRLPVGRPVRLELSAGDVIHSFWVPSLAGKQDMIPGRENILQFTVPQPGSWRGQCAEFCGLQHSYMALHVVATAPAEFAAWRRAQQRDAAPQSADGQRIFEQRQCGGCHSVRGTQARGATGPDLTHVASRRSIGAGLLPMTAGAMAAWIADPQTLKPGNNMPLVPLSPDELQAVTAWLMTLE